VTFRLTRLFSVILFASVAAGAAGWDDCALTVLATVVSRPTPNRIVLDCGSKALSSDIGNLTGYGQLQGTDITLKFVNEEHGVIELDTPSDSPRIGERVRVIPNHACVVSNLFDVVNLVDGDSVVETVAVAARGRVD
jgi:D-serine deaminase-like pyridoxal phosphate-dependent protein